MGRRASVRYYPSRQAYFTHYDGKQHKLADGPDDSPSGPTFLAALDRFKRIMELGSVNTALEGNVLRAVCETYIAHLQGRRSPGTVRIRKGVLRPFLDFVGEMKVGELNHATIDRFIAHQRKERSHGLPGRKSTRWADGSVRAFLKSINATLNWAVGRELIARNPVKGYEVPQAKKRGLRCLIRQPDHERLLALVGKAPLRNLILALHASAARPGELMAADCKDWDEAEGAIVYRGDDYRREDDFRHKTAGECKDRVIRFAGEALELVRSLVRTNQKGPIFRGKCGARWTQTYLTRRFRGLRARLEMPELIPYSYRHTFATEWLENGGSIDLLAEIMGNTPETIRKYYRHISPRSESVKAAFQAFRGGK